MVPEYYILNDYGLPIGPEYYNLCLSKVSEYYISMFIVYLWFQNTTSLCLPMAPEYYISMFTYGSRILYLYVYQWFQNTTSLCLPMVPEYWI